METKQDINRFLSLIIQEGLYINRRNLQYHLDTLFKEIDLKDKKVLDIGGGSGLHSFYAAFRGAKRVVCVEPEAEGSSLGITDKFYRLKKLLKYNNVELKPLTFQKLESNDETFDVIILHNSINHLNEIACINLTRDTKSKAVYQELLSKIFSLSNYGAKLIICDCSRNNFFSLLKIGNPFASSIEWHKHQSPEVWVKLLRQVGFANPKIRWLSFNTLRNLGRFLTGNKLAAYFLTSQFCLTMDKA